MEISTRKKIRAAIVAVPVAALAIWTKSFYIFVPLVAAVWFYLYSKEWNTFRQRVRMMPYKAKRIVTLTFSTFMGIAITTYLALYFVEVRPFHVPGYGTHVCLVNKAKYGGVKFANDPDNYHRTCHIGSIARNDMAAINIYIEGERHKIISRIAALPGDTVAIDNGCAIINGIPADSRRAVCTYTITQHTPHRTIHDMERAIGHTIDDSARTTQLPTAMRIAQWQQCTYAPMPPNQPDMRIFPYSPDVQWNAYNLGPFVLPYKGMTVELTPANKTLYSNLITHCEGGSTDNGETHYTFKLNYYWVMCDNRDICNDSRAYGPIPENRIIGNTTLLF